MNNEHSKLRMLVEGAIMIALATVLSFWKVVDMPFGGSITLEMIPLVVMALRNGPKAGCLTGFAHGLLQMIIGFSNVLYCATLLSQIGCICLDYLLAFTVLGLAGLFAKMFKRNWRLGYIVGAVLAGLLRYACSFLSGWLLWGSYAPDGMNVVWYSLSYNGIYMIPDIIITAVIVAALVFSAPMLFFKTRKKED